MKNQQSTNLLLVGNDITSDIVIQNNLSHHGYVVDYVTTEQDLINRILAKTKKIDLIVISDSRNRSVVSDNIISNINLPVLILKTNSEKKLFLLDVSKSITTAIRIYNHEKEENKEGSDEEDQLDAFALHEIICDDKGNPIDYRFLDADKKFLKRLNKTKEELIGKTALELFPQTEKIWIETFGRVALSGKPEVLLQYSVEFENYYEARIYSPEKGKFLALFIDMKKKKGSYLSS